MKNKKLIIVSILIIAFILLMTNFVHATDNTPIIDVNGDISDLVTGDNNEPTNNDNASGDGLTVVNQGTSNNGETDNKPADNANENLANEFGKYGIAEDSTLFIFIAVCIGSAIYAYIKIRKYNDAR